VGGKLDAETLFEQGRKIASGTSRFAGHSALRAARLGMGIANNIALKTLRFADVRLQVDSPDELHRKTMLLCEQEIGLRNIDISNDPELAHAYALRWIRDAVVFRGDDPLMTRGHINYAAMVFDEQGVDIGATEKMVAGMYDHFGLADDPDQILEYSRPELHGVL